MTEPDANTPPQHGFNPLAGLLAFLVPGLGHVFRGDRWRGAYAFVGVFGLFLSGLLVGGIDVVDSKENIAWYIGQAITGPAVIITDAIHQRNFKAVGPARQGLQSQQQNADRVRSGFPDEKRVVDAAGTARWQRLTPDEVAAGAGPVSRKSIGRMNEIGTLFVLVAGMLNLIVILDALFPTIRPAGSNK